MFRVMNSHGNSPVRETGSQLALDTGAGISSVSFAHPVGVPAPDPVTVTVSRAITVS